MEVASAHTLTSTLIHVIVMPILQLKSLLVAKMVTQIILKIGTIFLMELVYLQSMGKRLVFQLELAQVMTLVFKA